MENIRNASDIIARMNESVDFYTSRINALKAIKRLTKKDGSNFAIASKNFEGDKSKQVYITITPRYDYTAKANGYRLSINYYDNRHRWQEDWIDFLNVDEAFEKIASHIASSNELKAKAESEREKSETIAKAAIAKLDEISKMLDDNGIEKHNTLRYAIGALIKDYEYRI